MTLLVMAHSSSFSIRAAEVAGRPAHRPFQICSIHIRLARIASDGDADDYEDKSVGHTEARVMASSL
jgi:hypothetical protein